MSNYMAKKLAVGVRKGGSAKTTTAINLATALHLRGKRVLLVDVDPQANATLAVGLNPKQLTRSINDLFVSDMPPKEAIAHTAFGLAILPAHRRLSETQAGMKVTQLGRLRAILALLEDEYDFIVIDTPPGEGHLGACVLIAADEVLIPVQAEYLAVHGLGDTLSEIEEVRSGLNPHLKVVGILPTHFHPRTNLGKTVLEMLKSSCGQLLLSGSQVPEDSGTQIPIKIEYSIKHSEASLAGQPIVLYDPRHQGAIAYQQIAERFV